jgi:hypothetical protein
MRMEERKFHAEKKNISSTPIPHPKLGKNLLRLDFISL